MTRRNHGIVAVALGGVVALTASACGGGASTPGANKDGASAAKPGGTLYYLSKRPSEHMDPQRTYLGRDLANQSRLVYRTLTQYKSGPKEVSKAIQPDLATDTGQVSDGGKTWKFTLKDGVKWEDNSDITCEDLKYGISRTFAVDVITGGPLYALQFLDIPKNAKGGSIYKGPYVKDAAGQAAFEKAVTCAGKTVTYKLGQPVGDFNLAVTMSAFAPYKKTQDKGDKSNFAIFSSGPYKAEGGVWAKGKGATFVRNPAYDPKTDTLRGAFPEKFVFTEGIEDEVIAQRLISDSGNDKFAVTDRRIPASKRPEITSNPALKSRHEIVLSPYMHYLVPNFKRMTNPKVREALAISTDKAGWIAASGGTTAGQPSQTIIQPEVLGYKAHNAFSAPDKGDPVKAKALLTEAGVPIPYPINMTFNGGTPTSKKTAAALKAGWEAAGFAVTLNELTDTYYEVIQNPANAQKYDVTWAAWGADWPSASTVIPPLFDGRIQLSAASNGNDYGYYNNPEMNKKMDAAFAETDLTKQGKLWGEMDEILAKEVAFIPLMNEKFFLMWGSGVKGWVDNPSTSNFPDLGAVGVQ